MEKSTIVFMILGIAVILYCTELLPSYVTSTLAVLSMVLTGIIDFSTAFSALGSSTVLLLVGMFIIGRTIVDVGLSDIFGKYMIKNFDGNIRKFTIVMCCCVAVISMFVNSLVVMTIVLTVIDSISSKSKGMLSRKKLYMPCGIVSMYGSVLSAIGTTSMMNVSAQLAASEFGRGLKLFEPAVVAFPAIIVSLLFIITIGNKLSDKLFGFDADEVDYIQNSCEMQVYSKRKILITLIVFVAVLFLLVWSPIPHGLSALIGAAVLIVTGCSEKNVINHISWSTIFLIATSVGIGCGVSSSGAGEILAHFMIRICGPFGNSSFLMCCCMMFITTLMSNFMSNNAAVTIVCPIALALAKSLGGINCMMPFALACGIGANLSVSTPVSCASLSVTTVAGYRFMNYVIYGGIINLLACILCCVSMYIMYFV